MDLEPLKARVPEHAKDLRLNLDALTRVTELTPRQTAGALLASALAAREPTTIRLVDEAVRGALDDGARRAARTAAALMAMTNVYYRFVHLASDPTYGQLPAKLRMQALANPGVDAVDFELWSLAVSIVNGCGACIDSHEKSLRGHGVKPEAVQAIARVAAVVHAVAATLDAEAALA